MEKDLKSNKFWNDSIQVNFFKNKHQCPRIREFLSKIKSPNSKKVLDLGCGGGRNTEMLLKMGFDTYGLDHSPAMIRATRKRLAKFFPPEQANKRIILGSMLNLPYPDGRFNVIISTGVYHQACSEKEYTKAIKESSRVLKQRGWLALNIFIDKVWDKTYTKVDGERHTVITKDDLYMTLLPKKRFLRMMANSGFELVGQTKEETKQINKGPRCVLRAVFRRTR